MKEAMTRSLLIDPALRAKGWTCAVPGSLESHWEEEYPVAAGRIGRDAKHHNPKSADYVFFVGGKKVAVLEAKRDGKSADEAEAQAKNYARSLGLRLAYATNGDKLIEFKQIVGRGTRVCEGKNGFTIYDFTGASEHIKHDDFWDDDPKCPKCGHNPCTCGHGGGGGDDDDHPPCPTCGCWPCVCPKPPRKEIIVKLSSGREITATWEREVVFDGELISVDKFLERFIRAVKNAAGDPSELRTKWQSVDSREELLKTLDEQGFTLDRLADIRANLRQQDYDVFDVILELAYDVEPITRAIRAERVRETLDSLPDEQRAFAEIVLGNYMTSGVWSLSRSALHGIIMGRYHSIADARKALGLSSVEDIFAFCSTLQSRLYAA